ncbi:MAG: type II secretion system protein GspG [Acidobacteria bacterium]|nr:type II secretion system protein GspG [Acidobacteriota bacterium]MBV9478085.1 type II secretion system protein GspG [Acidobacteriota bacterium]
MLRRLTVSLAALALILVSLPLAADSGSCHRKLVDHTGFCLFTLSDMRSVQMAVDAYWADHNAYPVAATMAELQHALEPVYIAHLPAKDFWGTEFRYVVARDGKSYRLVSAGSDRKFDESSWSAYGLTSASSDDAVLASDHERQWTIQE